MNFRLLIFLAALVAMDAMGSLMVPLAIEEMSTRAQLIVRGTVLSKSCQRDAAGRIYTKVALDVSEIWKGSHTGKLLTIVHGGGILGEERVVVSNQVDYQIGEEVVAFLVLNERGEAVTLGLSQGKFHVWRDGAQLQVRNPFHGTGIPDSQAASLQNRGGATSGRMTLTELQRRVQQKGEIK